MKILITGNMGYIGPLVVAHFRRQVPSATIVGFDIGFFASCVLDPLEWPERSVDTQFYGDVRQISADALRGVDVVVHLAAISNDPMGKAFETVTDEVNFQASLRLAELSKRAGVRSFVFASSCSVYGAAGADAKTESSELCPLTAYARSKVATEQALAGVADANFTVTCLRFSTACGFSPRLRLDLVLNDFVASALTTGQIMILSDGTPWRPLIDVRDMARAIEWAALRSNLQGGEYLVLNVGAMEANYQVKTLATAVRAALPGVKVVISPDGQPDKRSYKVDFTLFRRLAPNHVPQVTLAESVEGLVGGLRRAGFADANFRQSRLIRLNILRDLRAAGRFDERLFAIAAGAGIEAAKAA